MVVIGLGSAGSGIANHFSDIHTKITITESDFPENCVKEEDFEEHCPSLSQFANCEFDECWLFLCGGSKCSSATLRLLETIKDKKINIGYVFPDLDWASPQVTRRHKVVFNVLQEYARSGLLNNITIFSNKDILNIIGDQSITKMYDMINKQIANTVETILWFQSQEPVLGSAHLPKEISRISTVSMGNLKKNEEKMMFLLDNITETGYIYSISKNQLENNKDLLKLIKSRVSDDENNKINSSFAVYPSEHKQSFFYALKYTHHIQPWR
tara:strand:+ start:1254 stop:2060 length:807 start_codon:yes stop_codon:yes gene_type:complete